MNLNFRSLFRGEKLSYYERAEHRLCHSFACTVCAIVGEREREMEREETAVLVNIYLPPLPEHPPLTSNHISSTISKKREQEQGGKG